MTDPSFCRWCGQASDRCGGECRGDAMDAPPRFCPVCRRRLVRDVTLGYFAARCRDHGQV